MTIMFNHVEPVYLLHIYHEVGKFIGNMDTSGSEPLPPNHQIFALSHLVPAFGCVGNQSFVFPTLLYIAMPKNYSRGNVLTAFLINLARCKKGTSRSGGQAGNSEFTFG